MKTFFDINEVDLQSVPPFDGMNAYLVLLKFDAAPVVGQRYYFPQNNRIDERRVTGLRVHYNDGGAYLGSPLDMAPTFLDNRSYAVISDTDYKNLYITLVNSRHHIKLNKCPASTFIVLPTNPAPGLKTGYAPRPVKALSVVCTIGNCYITFSAAVGTVAPFVVPITIYYQ